MYSFTRVAVTNYHKVDGLKQQKSILSQFWGPEVWIQGVNNALSSLKTLWEDPSLSLPSFWWLPEIFSVPWPVGASIQSLPSFIWLSSLSLCVSVSKLPSSTKDTSPWIRTHLNPVWFYLNLINLQRLYFQIKSHLQVPAVKSLT